MESSRIPPSPTHTLPLPGRCHSADCQAVPGAKSLVARHSSWMSCDVFDSVDKSVRMTRDVGGGHCDV